MEPRFGGYFHPMRLNIQFLGIKLSLAKATIVGRPPGLNDPRNCAPAFRGSARMTFAIIGAESMLKVPKLTISLSVITKRGAPRCNGLAQDFADDRHKFCDPIT